MVGRNYAATSTSGRTVIGEYMVIRAVISRNTLKSIELATSPCFRKSERRHTNVHTRDYLAAQRKDLVKGKLKGLT